MDLLTSKNFIARMLKQREEPPTTTPSAHVGNILVVDDSRTIVHALQLILVRAGHATIPAFDGLQAIDLARKHMPDLILMDIVMPNMNGFEATRALKADPHTKQIPIVIISGSDQMSDKMWGTRLGARAFLTKPINKEELLAKISAILAQQQRGTPALARNTTTVPTR